MALDSREKRAAALGVGRPWVRDKLPGANDQEWRIASGNAYGGNALSPAAGRIMGALAGRGGLAGEGGLAGIGGGLAC
jgi:hypothetical protein